MRTILVVDYDPTWLKAFEQVKSYVWPTVADFADSIEHVGSTSVPGLAAKPVVDIDIVVATETDVAIAIRRLAQAGYTHRGNLGVEGREAFDVPDWLPAHHLYVCPRDSAGLVNHLAVRDYLRSHPDVAHAYGELKKRLASEFPHDIDSYVDGKTDLLLEILREAKVPSRRLEAVERANRKGRARAITVSTRSHSERA